MNFVVKIKINEVAQNHPDGPDMANIFRWTLHRFTGRAEGETSNLDEASGPTLASGTAASVDNAKATAEAYAAYYNQETVYVFKTA